MDYTNTVEKLKQTFFRVDNQYLPRILIQKHVEQNTDDLLDMVEYNNILDEDIQHFVYHKDVLEKAVFEKLLEHNKFLSKENKDKISEIIKYK